MSDILRSRTVFRVAALCGMDPMAACEVATILSGAPIAGVLDDLETRRMVAITRLARHCQRVFDRNRDLVHLAPTPLAYYDSWRPGKDETSTENCPPEEWRIVRERLIAAHNRRTRPLGSGR